MIHTQRQLPNPDPTLPTNWSDMICRKRIDLGETQKVFGTRFGVSGATVSNWEHGLAEAPYKVTWWLLFGNRNYMNEFPNTRDLVYDTYQLEKLTRGQQ